MTCRSIGIIGCGNMGGAFLKALQNRFPDVSVYVYEPDAEKTKGLEVQICSSPAEAAEKSDITILAVKPQLMENVAASLPKGKYISLAAGVTLSRLKEILQTSEVVRFMPTIAALACASPTAVSWDEDAPPSFCDDAVEIADAAGFAVKIPEHQISPFIGVSGSGIAFIFQFIHALALGGTRKGLTYAQSLVLAQQTMHGALAVLEQTGKLPSEALTMVTSPGGTTIEGIHALESGGFTAAVMNAVSAAADTSNTMLS